MAREFGWTLPDMKELRPTELVIIMDELNKQKRIEGAGEQYNKWAFLASVITNGFNFSVQRKTKPKLVKPEDFLDEASRGILKGKFPWEASKMPSEEPKKNWEAYIQEAQKKGLNGPWKGGEEKC